MSQASPVVEAAGLPKHIAIIMDGNGRWANQRGLPRTQGHRKGVEAVREVARAARDMGIKYLTLYAFSSENWNRPASEVTDLFAILKFFIRRDLAELHQNNVRLRIIGSLERVPDDVRHLLQEATSLTKDNDGQNLIIAFNYGSRNEIARAARKLAEKVAKGEMSPEQIDEQAMSDALDTSGIPDPDLMIRTSGEIRLSNFLLYQLAYSEFVFVDCLWPDFGKQRLEEAINEYQGRCRKFGGLVAEANS